MPGKSHAYSDAVLNVLNGNGRRRRDAVSSPCSPWRPATMDRPGTELAGNGYQRQGITFGAPASWRRQRPRRSRTRNNIQFGPATADWLQAVAFGIFDAQSNGHLLYWNTLAAPKIIQMGDFGQFAPGSFVVEED